MIDLSGIDSGYNHHHMTFFMVLDLFMLFEHVFLLSVSVSQQMYIVPVSLLIKLSQFEFSIRVIIISVLGLYLKVFFWRLIFLLVSQTNKSNRCGESN